MITPALRAHWEKLASDNVFSPYATYNRLVEEWFSKHPADYNEAEFIPQSWLEAEARGEDWVLDPCIPSNCAMWD